MKILEIDQLDSLNDDQLWEAAADTRNFADIRLEAIQRWLFPDDVEPDVDPDELSGGRLHDLRRRATILEPDEIEEDDVEEFDRTAPYFDGQGRLLLEHDGVIYLIDSLEDEGGYDGVNNRNDIDLYATDDKTVQDRDI